MQILERLQRDEKRQIAPSIAPGQPRHAFAVFHMSNAAVPWDAASRNCQTLDVWKELMVDLGTLLLELLHGLAVIGWMDHDSQDIMDFHQVKEL